MTRLSSESTRLSLIVLHSTQGTLRGEASFFFFLIEKEKKRLTDSPNRARCSKLLPLGSKLYLSNINNRQRF